LDTLERVNLEIEPEPTPDERAALIAAFERLLGEQERREPSAWWREGVREGIEGGPQPGECP
jgi:hypothetical protein